jgi:hypothetical protein
MALRVKEQQEKISEAYLIAAKRFCTKSNNPCEKSLLLKAVLNDTVDFRSGPSLSSGRIKQILPRAFSEPAGVLLQSTEVKNSTKERIKS